VTTKGAADTLMTEIEFVASCLQNLELQSLPILHQGKNRYRPQKKCVSEIRARFQKNLD
jgi:hypothetical protein